MSEDVTVPSEEEGHADEAIAKIWDRFEKLQWQQPGADWKDQYIDFSKTISDIQSRHAQDAFQKAAEQAIDEIWQQKVAEASAKAAAVEKQIEDDKKALSTAKAMAKLQQAVTKLAVNNYEETFGPRADTVTEERKTVKELITLKKQDFWIQQGANVLLIGKHGVGKTHIGIAAAKRHKMKMQYYSCATMDPWVDFIGIPKTKHVKRGDKKASYLELVRPKAWAFDEVEFLFLDELNRADPKITNAVLELIQFRSINGKKFKNLKCIWAAINPSAAETGDVMYNVEVLDPALESRFHVRVNLPFEPAEDYFTSKFGQGLGKNACSWWMSLDEKTKNEFPPRSMDYAIDFASKGGDVEDVLPEGIARADFIKVLDKDFNVEDVIVEKYDLITAASDAVTVQLMRNIRYAANRGSAAPYIKRVREATTEEITTLLLDLLSGNGGATQKESMTFLTTLIASVTRPARIRLLSNLYTSYMDKADDEDDAKEVVAAFELSDEQVRNAGLFITKKLPDYGASFKYRKKSKLYELTAFDHDDLRPVEASTDDDAEAILRKQQAHEAKKMVGQRITP